MATISEALAIAIQHHQAGRLQSAEHIYRQILHVQADQPDALHLLGVIAHQVGKHELAVEYIGRAIQLQGNAAAFHNNLGTALQDLGKLDEAVACYRRALELEPDYADAYSNLGVTFKDQGRLEEAVACCRAALALRPDCSAAYNNLGTALNGQRKLDEAIACYRRALELKANYAEAHCNLGNGLKDQGKLGEAVACYRRALELKPDFAEALSNLGNVLKDQGDLDEAVACCRRALELNPDYAESHNNLGNALKEQGKPDEAVSCYRRALELKPDFAKAHSNLLFGLQYCSGVTPAALAHAHAEYDRRYAAPLRNAFSHHEHHHGFSRRLRLGFVSSDLGRHPVGYFLVRILENLSRHAFQTICYSDRIVKDDLTSRLHSAATHWRDVHDLSDQRLAERIRADRIDILFDLAGHTAHNRLLVFARKPAPIQMTWAGYVGTTGLKAMDYLLADHYEIPPGTEHCYQEQVLRMPDGYVCYDPPDDAPPVTPLPALQRGAVTFCCFNNPAKITPQTIEVWAQILRRLPQSRLVLKFKGWNDHGIVRRFTEMFAAQAIDAGRLEFLGRSPHAELLAEYQRMDLALDPFPYCGGLTTCEALWMGVPVITCPGETFAGRHSLSHLSNVGLTETIAHDLDEYVELAVALAGDLPRLSALRSALRPRMATSPLCDGKRFAAHLTSLLQDVWERSIGTGGRRRAIQTADGGAYSAASHEPSVWRHGSALV
jgi:predicted O-linked N-acetylglucosamine transferase (SPINDLY family)